MASSSSSSPQTWRYKVFTSFHGPDVRKTFLSHLRKQFSYNGITMFDDQGIERSQTIAPALTKAIKESKISMVVLSKNYASSGWCLNELVEILACREDMGQIVMTVFYGVDPSDVRKQTGDFGIAFNETCACKTREERQRWSQALNYVGNIAGEHLLNWENEATMIEKIAKDVLDKLNFTPSRDFDGMVGLGAHLRKMQNLLDLDNDGVKVVAISGPAGIGKTTIARALHSQLSSMFQLTCFVDNLRGSYHSGFDEYGYKLQLQEHFLSKVLNHNGMRICHLGAVKENLSDQKVLIVLDDVNNLNQLEALANETTWFGSGSRIVVTTENLELLQQHGIDNTYHVQFPSDEEALKILCTYAFRQTSPRHGFEKRLETIIDLCGKLPLGLRVVGSSLHGKKEDEWEDVMNRLDNVLDRNIEDVLRVGYESLDENEQTLFQHIAVFFNYEDSNLLKAMFADGNLDVKRGLKILVNRSLVDISRFCNNIVMHKLLQKMARQTLHKQEPWKRQILVDAQEICGVLEDESVTSSVVGISFDIFRICDVSISKNVFKRMRNLRFLSVYESIDDGNDRVHIPKGMEFPRRLRLLNWEAYPSKSLPHTFHPEYLVKLNMQGSQLEYLWKGVQPLTNLKEMNLEGSFNLKEIPDLSRATNLEKLNLIQCQSLVEIPSSFSNLHKLKKLYMWDCIKLEVIPPHMNLASLEDVDMRGCSRLRKYRDMSMNVIQLDISRTSVVAMPASIRFCSRLIYLTLFSTKNIKEIKHLPTGLKNLDLRDTDIESIPDCIKDLHMLQYLDISGCNKLTSLPELPCSLSSLDAYDCESLEIICFPLNTPNTDFNFSNCFKLGQQARRSIIQQSKLGSVVLPGKELPEEFNYRGRGNSITIPLSTFTRFKFCILISPNLQFGEDIVPELLCHSIIKGDVCPVDEVYYIVRDGSKSRTEHLFIFDYGLLFTDPSEVSREIVFEFSSKLHDFNIIECGALILTSYKTIEEGVLFTKKFFDSEVPLMLNWEVQKFKNHIKYNNYERDTLTWKHLKWLDTPEGLIIYWHYKGLLSETVPATLTKQQKSIGQPMGYPHANPSWNLSLGELFWFHIFLILPDRLLSNSR